MTTERDSTMTLDELVAAKFRSGNSIPVERIVITRSEYDDHLATRDAVVSDDRMVRRGLQVAKDVVECLREGAVYIDEEGEDTNALEAFLESLASRKVAVPEEMYVGDARNPFRNLAIGDGYACGWNACLKAMIASQDEVK